MSAVDVVSRPVLRAVAGHLRDAEVEHLDDGLAVGRLARNRFAGLRSRCTMPSACASATASHA